MTALRVPARLLAAALAAAAPAARAQAPGTPGPAGRPVRLTVAVAGGYADLYAESSNRTRRRGPLGLLGGTDRHALVAVTAARPGLPLEGRAEVVAVPRDWSAASTAVALSGVLPVGRLRVGPGALRPYAVAGVGGYTAAERGPVNWNAGYGLRYEGRRYGTFVEVRRQQAYNRTFATLGFTRTR